LRPSWFENQQFELGKLTNKAFRRSEHDTDGLSVGSSHEAAKNLQRSGCGVAALAIVSIESLGLSLIKDDDNHGHISGLPIYTSNPANEDYDRATQLADKLLKIAEENLVQDHWRRD
jgi:hypothetical protein